MLKVTELTAYCGLYCSDCIRYRSRASDLARELLCELKNLEFHKYAEIKGSSAKQMDVVRQFEHYSRCCDVLEAIAALQCNNPCRVGEGCPTFSCLILECCRKQGFKGCWRCNVFESCAKLDSLRSIHGDTPRQNLRIIKELGLKRWAQNRRTPYIWQG
jgi:hypothetical protein